MILPPAPESGLYLHIPFCSAICPYCDFAVLTGESARRAAFVEALIAEIELHRGNGGAFDTVYLGGGTPSILSAEQLERVLGAARDSFAIGERCRFFLEANPEDASPENLADWRRLGIGTLSIGVQSFRDEDLRFLGRRHRRTDARRSVELARETGFETLSIDLIYGLPARDLASWEETLAEAVRLEPDHISCYQLTVHDGTPFGRRRREGRLEEIGESAEARLFEETHVRLEAAGYEAYEVSSFARSREHRSRHNEKYWNHTPYLGLGPSAHSFDGRHRWWNERDLETWEGRVRRGERPVAGKERLGSRELMLEALMLGLRTVAGVPVARLSSLYGISLAERNRELIERYARQGLLVVEADRLRPTRRGLAVADALAASFDLGDENS